MPATRFSADIPTRWPKGGRPVVLAEHNVGLRKMANSQERDPVAFWEKLNKLPTLAEVPDFVRPLLEKWLPEPGLTYRVVHRTAGLGSLGRRRFTALADWRGGSIARETKELIVSAWGWEDPPPAKKRFFTRRSCESGARPRSVFSNRRIVDRAPVGALLQPHRIGASAGEARREETAARDGPRNGQCPLRRHGNARRDRPRSFQRGPKWLATAAHAMADDVTRDWNDWKKPATAVPPDRKSK